ncbi:MAG TPA: tetratricopeptide repeat protein [Candidatus Dormibacteraeota bacterium]|nr:tetratricopeptide repeat protein [Candidatus Dormibacteraeota bacterium]
MHGGPWIYGPWLDLIIGCGAWSAPFLLLSYFVARDNPRIWPFAFYFLALLFNYPHFMATIYRAYHTRSEFAKYRVFTVHVTLLLVVAGILVHAWYALLPWLFTIYICWSPWHYSGQNFGLLMMFARRSGVAPTKTERQLIWLAFAASYLMLMLSFHTGASNDFLVLSLGLPAKITVPVRAALAVFFGGAILWSFGSMAKRSSWRSLLPSAILSVTQFLWFLLPAIIELTSGRDVQQTRYSSGILAVLHSAQYLWITSYYQERESRALGANAWSVSRYLVILIAGGIALFIPGPWIVSRALHVDFAASFLTFMALVNIHHFILDGALWKLRDSKIATLLLNPDGNQKQQTNTGKAGFLGATRWLAGNSTGARVLRISAIVLLLTWGAFDQLHFFYSSRADDTSALTRAAAWNPDDSAVQIKLARAEMNAGKPTEALVPLRRAAEVNPANISLQKEYAQGLIAAGKTAEAYAEYQQILRRDPKLAQGWINLGLLARQLGHKAEAADDWQKAVDLSPENATSQLYLAEVLDQRSEIQAAARHYREYLKIVATHQDEHKSEQAQILSALLKVADADAVARRDSDALVEYRGALANAEKSGETAFASLALVHLADLQEKQGDAAAALDSYQRGLTLDQKLNEPESTAVDWFNYGQFLRRQKQPGKLALACFLQAEKLAGDKTNEEGIAIEQAKREVEASVGTNAAAQLRKDFSQELQDALNLPPDKLKARQ